MQRSIFAFAAAFAALVAQSAGAAEPGAPSLARLAGNTLNAVAYWPNPANSRNGGLARVMVQAYLRPDGRALVRMWDAARGGYTAVSEREWNLKGSTLCLDLPNERFCADVHVWGPRISGMGMNPYAMLDGDLQPGNTVTGTR